MSPGVAQSFDRAIDHRAPIIFDAEYAPGSDLADLACPYGILSRNLVNAGKQSWFYGHDRAGAAFAEEGVFGG